jgi:hypothetical protein
VQCSVNEQRDTRQSASEEKAVAHRREDHEPSFGRDEVSACREKRDTSVAIGPAEIAFDLAVASRSKEMAD